MSNVKIDTDNNVLTKNAYAWFNFHEVADLDYYGKVDGSQEFNAAKHVYVFRSIPDKGENVYKLYAHVGRVNDGTYYTTIENPSNPNKDDDLLIENNPKENETHEAKILCPTKLNKKPIQLFVCISQIELCKDRIKQIIKKPYMRCFYIDMTKDFEKSFGYSDYKGSINKNADEKGFKKYTVATFDYIDFAVKLNQSYQKALNDYHSLKYDMTLKQTFDTSKTQGQSRNSDISIEENEMTENRRLRKYTAGLVQQLITEKIEKDKPIYNDLRESLAKNGEELFSELRAFAKEEENQYKFVKESIDKLVDFISDSKNPYFTEMQKDYILPIEQEIFEEDFADITERISVYDKGRKCILESWKNSDHVLGPNGFFQTVKVVADGPQVKASNATLKIFNELCQSIYTEPGYKKNVKAILKTRFGVIGELGEYEKAVDVVKKGAIQFKKFDIPPQTFKSLVFEPAADSKVAWKKFKNEINEFNNKIGLILDAVSFIDSYQNILKKQSKQSCVILTKDSLALIASIFTIIGKEKFNKWNPLFTAVTSSIDAGLAINASFSEAKRADYDAAVCKNIQAFGAACVAISGALRFMALASTATGVGAGAGAAFFIAGTAISIIGIIGYAIADDPPVKEFIVNCPWGKEGFKKYGIRSKNEYIEKELDFIHPIINGFQAKGWIKRNPDGSKAWLVIDIYPRLFEPTMEISVDVTSLKTYFSQECHFKSGGNKFIVSEKNSQVIEQKDKVSFIRNEREIDSGTSNVVFNISIDVYGDKAFVLPDKKKPLEIKFEDVKKQYEDNKKVHKPLL